MNVICFREIIKRNLKKCPRWMTHSKHGQNPILLFFFWEGDFNFNFFTFCVLQPSFMHKLLLGKHVSSRYPAGIAQQSQDKQVPVLRLFSVSELFGTELHAPLPCFAEFMESTKYVFILLHITLNTVQWHELKRRHEGFALPFLVFIWFQICPKALPLIC